MVTGSSRAEKLEMLRLRFDYSAKGIETAIEIARESRLLTTHLPYLDTSFETLTATISDIFNGDHRKRAVFIYTEAEIALNKLLRLYHVQKDRISTAPIEAQVEQGYVIAERFEQNFSLRQAQLPQLSKSFKGLREATGVAMNNPLLGTHLLYLDASHETLEEAAGKIIAGDNSEKTKLICNEAGHAYYRLLNVYRAQSSHMANIVPKSQLIRAVTLS